MQMTDSFASAVAVSIPIFALAAGAEHAVDPDDPADVLHFITGMPGFSNAKGKTFFRLVLSELEGAIERAADKTDEESGDA